MPTFHVRTLLDVLASVDRFAIDRLCAARGFTMRSLAARCEALARSYRGRHAELFEELRRADLLVLLRAAEVPDVGSRAKEELVALAVRAFAASDAPASFDGESTDDGADEADEDDELDDDDSASGHRSDAYAEALEARIAYRPHDVGEPRPYQREAVARLGAALDTHRARLRDGLPTRPPLLHVATGGGKTRIANDVIRAWLGRHPGPVLWMTKDWRLLEQAAQDFGRRDPERRCLSRIGGDGRALHPLPKEDERGAVFYSTIQTVQRRLDARILQRLRPTLVVWDECHWGEHAGARAIVRACLERHIPVLGLSATPHDDTNFEIAYRKTFPELVEEGFLARPEIVDPIATGVRWRPERRSPHDDFTARSLHELGRSRARNRRIVDAYAARVGRYDKTIVFACDIQHAERLASMFAARGYASRPIHSRMDSDAQRRILDEFRSGAIVVLVNVAMLTHGIDVPDARTVFLCRPTASPRLFMQMVGRASRLDHASGKTSFSIVEFTDNLEQHGDCLVDAGILFGAGRPANAPRRPSRWTRALHDAHGFDPNGAPTWIPDVPGVPESLRGLWYRRDQTFGIELELTRPGEPIVLDDAWAEVAEELRRRLARGIRRVAPRIIRGYAGRGSELEKDVRMWNVEYDSSAGWEVTTRILKNEEGFAEIDRGCAILERAARDLGLAVNHATGTHVHLGWRSRDAGEIVAFLSLAKLFEPALGTLVAPSRLVSFDDGSYDVGTPNEYCRPISHALPSDAMRSIRTFDEFRRSIADDEQRYVTVNVRNIEGSPHDTVETRMHSGTLEAKKILLWVSLWQQMLWAALHHARIPEVRDTDVFLPNGDIVELAAKWLPNPRQRQQYALLRRLHARRMEVVETWRRAPSLADWVAFARRWRSPEAVLEPA